MKKTIRRMVFETNSSSTHSFTLTHEENHNPLIKDEDGNVVVTLRQFGWNYECDEAPNDPNVKLSYLVQLCLYENEGEGVNSKGFKDIEKAIESKIVIDDTEDWHYIDHQSQCNVKTFLEGVSIKEFILNSNYELDIDNDNH